MQILCSITMYTCTCFAFHRLDYHRDLFPIISNKFIIEELEFKTSPDNKCSLQSIIYNLKIYQNLWFKHFLCFFMK